MKKTLLLATIALIGLSGCSTTYIVPSDVMQYDLTGRDISTLKVSTICAEDEAAQVSSGLTTTKDISVKKAAELGHIKTVYSVDTKIVWNKNFYPYLPMTIDNMCTTVYGE